jgi:glycosyltransferase involved in cell wall biosynthesis
MPLPSDPIPGLGRAVILASRLSGYSAACQRELVKRCGTELLVIHWPASAAAPFDPAIHAHLHQRIEKVGQTRGDLLTQVRDFQPRAVLMAGWMDRDYLAIARALRGDGVPVIAGSDTQWKGGWRQQAGRVYARLRLHSAIDVLWVTGERQRQLALKLGFPERRIWTGYYSCDHCTFASGPRMRHDSEPAFLYAGRYVERKGLDTLLQAYQLYRSRVDCPWDLLTTGAGPLDRNLNAPGVRNLGFLQPALLAAAMQRASAFVLPSRYEPWGVVVQEAAAAGLPLLVSVACGASVHLVRDGFNGFTFPAGDAEALAQGMQRIQQLGDIGWAAFSDASRALAAQYTPEIWADTFVRGIDSLMKAPRP